MALFIVGQRWSSETEPELGLGTVLRSHGGQVQILFAACDEMRTYASDNAPLKRVRFRVGDTIQTDADATLTVQSIIERSGVLSYVSNGIEVPESKLSDRISLRGPERRLLAAHFDTIAQFDLRQRTLDLLHRCRKSPVRGFAGGRMALIPHQLYIVQEVASRHAPRVMLSDAVGLGKTIEACLILHRLLLSGRASRVLLLVPESLVHQWFVEMLRRFNISTSIFDEERCAAIEANDPDANPFLDDQLVLTSIDFLAGNPRRAAQAALAGWDVLVVDEAHHLKWSATAPSREYQIVDQLSQRSAGLLLLTATPEQLGIESHFARLRLLDPDRYRDLATFQKEVADYQSTARIAEKLLGSTKLTESDLASLRQLLGQSESMQRCLIAASKGDAASRQALLDNLLDSHGPGRVLFRNTRAVMSGFPQRRVHLVPLEPTKEAAGCLDQAAIEFAIDAGDLAPSTSLELNRDPRIRWLAELLEQLAPQKVLLICSRIDKVEAIDAALRRHLNVKTGIFHEGLTLLQRDRQAAWFAEPDGARLLLCSEIGSEGRNFQFAHHLVLFDLPLNPELLEQRIGRLDRIGQTEDIQIHVPYVRRSPQEVMARWYHEGLDAFESSLEGGEELFRRFGPNVRDLAEDFTEAVSTEADDRLCALVKETAGARENLLRVLEQGRDRLLELNSFRPAVAQKVISHIQAEDQDTELEEYLFTVFEHFGVSIEELSPRTWHLNPSGVTTDAFPAMPREGMVITRDRQRALSREDVGFLTWDHPIVSGTMDLLLGSETGNCNFAVFPDPRDRTLLIECCFILECIAPPHLHADRFLPATPIRVTVNQAMQECSAKEDGKPLAERLRKGSPHALLDNPTITQHTVPAMVKRAATIAEARALALREAATNEMNHLLNHEVQRLRTLRAVNDHIRPEEIQRAINEQAELATLLQQSRVRLDSVRLIWKGPPEMLE